MFYRFCFFSIFSIVALVTRAQDFTVIDNKGTLQNITRNSVDSSATTPTNPVEGDVWFDTNTDISKIYNGTSWLIIDVDSVSVSATTPTTPVMGDIWFDATTKITKVYDGTSWQNIQSDFSRALIDTDGDTQIQVEETADDDVIRFYTAGDERMLIDPLGNVGIGNINPHTNAILDLTNLDDKAFLLPSETLPINITSPTDGMLVYSSDNLNAYLRADSTWKPIAHNSVTNELIFDGDDDADNTNDNFYYVSMVINGDWKVIRYDKTDVNIELEANLSNNSGQLTQPISLVVCTGLIFN